MGAVPFSLPIAVCLHVKPVAWILDHWMNAIGFVLILILSWGVGWFLATLAGWFVIGPLYYEQACRNGAPFHVGDSVRLLIGPHAGRMVNVCQVWDGRGAVRVELGEQAREQLDDVYSELEVCRESA